MNENEMIPVIERVLEKWAGLQVNLTASSARSDLARAIADELACSIPASPLSGRRQVKERRASTINPFDLVYDDDSGIN